MSRRPVSPEDPLAERERRDRATVIIVVARGEDSLYRYTRETFESEPEVEIVLDRRREERRRRDIAPAVERRRADRRGTQRADLLKAQGWLIVRRRRDEPVGGV